MTIPHGYGGFEFGLSAETANGVIVLAGTVDDSRYRFESGVEHLGDGPLEGLATALPLRFVELLGLGPRPAPGEQSPVLFVETDKFEGAGRAGLAAAWSSELREGSVIEGDDWVLASVWVAWSINEEPIVDGFTFIDHARHGVAAVIESEAGTLLQPCTSTEIWIALCGVLPRSAELVADETGVPAS